MKELEQNIKQQLEERSIKPSAGAWDQIAKEVQKSPSKKRGFTPWLAAASILLVGALIIKLAFNNQTALNNEPSQTDSYAIKNSLPEEKENESLATEITENSETVIHTNENSDAPNNSIIEAEPKAKGTQTIANNVSQRIVEKAPTNTEKQKIQVIESEMQSPKTVAPKNNSQNKFIANNSAPQSVDTIKRKRVNINRDKLLFSVENEETVKKSKKVAFTDNTLKIDLNN